ncbi:MAG: hypothetical protein IGS39_16200 [Calothrix sp. C42_A2020_038]|nr:hypothetical protein [Calothrix sp. C42_A2020_038]
MKTKLLNICTVCLVTLAILSPEIVVFGIIWQQRLQLNQNYSSIHQVSPLQHHIYPHDTFISNPYNGFNHDFWFIINKFRIIFLLEFLLISIPVGIGISVYVYEKYLIYRAEFYRKKVEKLEEMWNKSNFW